MPTGYNVWLDFANQNITANYTCDFQGAADTVCKETSLASSRVLCTWNAILWLSVVMIGSFA